MRTTVTLDDDVAAKLKAEMRRLRSTSFKDTVNEVLRRGLLARRELANVPPFTVRARPLSQKPGLNFDNIGELIEQLESPAHK
jgi:hypothetical protein